MSVEIRKVASKRDLRKFIRFPYQLYKGNPNWVPALEGDEFRTFSPKTNGAYDYCESEQYLAYKDGKIVGRVAAIINKLANESWKTNVVRFGWLDFIDDVEVLKALIDAVIVWGKARGCDTIKGPWGFTDMDKEGLLVEGFDILSPFTCLYNYPYYDTLLKEIGFEKDVDWTQKIVEITEEEPPMYQYADMIEKRFGIHVAHPKNVQELSDKYGLSIFHMYNNTFAPLFQFTPLNDRQIKSYLQTYVPILDPRYVAVCLNDKDEPVGFTFCVPSLSKAVKKSGGKLFPFGFLRIFHALKHNDMLESLLIGVMPEYQGMGAHILMFKYIHDNARKAGIRKMFMNPQLEENMKVQTLFDQFQQKTVIRRRAYSKKID
ncbi:MAG: GNAT family N-acetyltransferase [Bacteroidales bacterium]|nr:GNAT family N-acetyltransferase [Bacteroidales bacterium]